MKNIIEQMAEVGLTGLSESELQIDGHLHRFRPDWEPKKHKKRGWYVLYLFTTDSGKTLTSGAFGWFKGAESFRFNVNLKDIDTFTRSDLERLKREQAEKRRLAQIEQKKEQQATAQRALEIWNKLPQQGRSEYLARKKVAAFNIRFSRGSIVLPVYGFDKVLSGLQFIDSEGNKTNLTGTVKEGRFCILGEQINLNEPLGVVEGYATGASVRMATGWVIFVTFGAGNLVRVAKAIRERYPRAKIVIFGDDDVDKPGNPGRQAAMAAAEAVSGCVIFPSKEA